MHQKPDRIRCNACPVRCYIREGASGACDRYGNRRGQLARLDPLVTLERSSAKQTPLVPFMTRQDDWDGDIVPQKGEFVTAVGAGTTYPDYKPAPFIVSGKREGVDTVTVVTEGIFSYCGVKLKIDTDRYLGAECSLVKARGETVGHVTTGEYGSQMLSLGGVHHLTGGSKQEGRVTCKTLLGLCNREAVELSIDNGATIVIQAGQAPIINGREEKRMRVGCGSATIGMFAKHWNEHVDEVVVVDDHITGVLSEHQAGKLLGVKPSGIQIKGHRSTLGRYFKVAEPGLGWGGTNIEDPLTILDHFNPQHACAGDRLLMVSTTGEQSAYFVLDRSLRPIEAELPEAVQSSILRIRENCEPALCSVLFIAGAGGSLRAGATNNPVFLTRSVKNSLTYTTSGGAPVFVWPGGGITFMVDVMKMPNQSFGYVPTPAIVAPIEFTIALSDYEAMGGHMGSIIPLESAMRLSGQQNILPIDDVPIDK